MGGALIEVGEALVWCVPCARGDGAVQLPDAIGGGRAAGELEQRRVTTFVRAVVDDGDARFEGRKRRRDSGISATVMRNQVGIDRTDHVVGTGERQQRIATEIAHVEEAKPPELQNKSRGARVLVRLLAARPPPEHAALGPAAPRSGVVSPCPAALTMVRSTFRRGIFSPAFGSRCRPRARTAA